MYIGGASRHGVPSVRVAFHLSTEKTNSSGVHSTHITVGGLVEPKPCYRHTRECLFSATPLGVWTDLHAPRRSRRLPWRRPQGIRAASSAEAQPARGLCRANISCYRPLRADDREVGDRVAAPLTLPALWVPPGCPRPSAAAPRQFAFRPAIQGPFRWPRLWV
jgi:hypothetical protein